MAPKRAAGPTGYDPIQRCQQWKRRVDREELAACRNVFHYPTSFRSPNPSSHQLDLLQQKLQHSVAYTAGMSMAQSPQKTVLDLAEKARPICTPSERVASTPKNVWKAQGSRDTPRSTSGSSSSHLRMELLEETQRRQAAESELVRLQEFISSRVTPRSSRTATPLKPLEEQESDEWLTGGKDELLVTGSDW
eukprot:CAMPEP_0114668888 /NCGR_PEP_ID=MMETSP0191-20121206/37068_1 /TAXON_ID=126664 /ORGANISM="Sorites sp." /LENGTH=191 /DNA_ID=CAMNT_0001923101 /DNA_START=38 /DNA_END=610 /DNA_ORIENTATION=+